ncbi:MAG: hypothetical protein AB1861_03155 [Cyanobacteriota bacterium]
MRLKIKTAGKLAADRSIFRGNLASLIFEIPPWAMPSEPLLKVREF